MPITQGRAFGAGSGGRYGSFEGRAETRVIGQLTQARAFGAHSGARYSSFAGRDAGGGRPVRALTQARAFGPHSGARYGDFTGRQQITPPPATGGGSGPLFRFEIPRELSMRHRAGLIEDDELIAIVVSTALPLLLRRRPRGAS